jgi:hypothetical protein
MRVISDRQAVELFHLHFARLLCSGPSKGSFAVKEGCNLRFFFESVRYSEDIDLDVAGLPVHALKERVSAVLSGPALSLTLRSRGIVARRLRDPDGHRRVQGAQGTRADTGALVQELRGGGAGGRCSGEAGAGVLCHVVSVRRGTVGAAP